MNFGRRLHLTCALGLILLVITACDSELETAPVPAKSAWRLVNPRPFAVQIEDMWGTSAQRMMAVGREGAVMTREGDQWREAPRPTRTTIFDIQGCDWQHIWAVCSEGLLFFDGSRWELRWPAPRSWHDRVYCRAPDDVMLVTEQGASFYFDGQIWTKQQLPIEPGWVSGDWLLGWPGGYTVIGSDGQASTWRDGQWGPVEIVTTEGELSHLVAITVTNFVDEEEVPLAFGRHAGDAGHIYTYQRLNRGGWQETDVWPLTGNLLDVVTTAGGWNFYTVSYQSHTNLVQVQASDSWLEPMDFPGLSNAVLRVFDGPVAGHDRSDHFILAGSFSTFFAGTHENGVEQSIGGLPFATHLLHVWPNGDFSGLDGRSGLIHGRADRITVQADTLAGRASAIWGPSPATIYTVGAQGRIMRLGPNSPSIQMSAPTTDDLHDIWGSSPDRIFAGGNTDFLAFDGSTWSAIATPPNFFCLQLQGTANGDVFVTGSRFLWQWDGADWTEVAAAADQEFFRELSVAPGGMNVFVLSNYYSFTGDTTFIRRWSDGSWTTLEPAPETVGDLVALSDNTLLVRSYDGLFIWQEGDWRALPVPEATQISSISADPTGGIYTLDDHGTIRYFDLGGTGLWQ